MSTIERPVGGLELDGLDDHFIGSTASGPAAKPAAKSGMPAKKPFPILLVAGSFVGAVALLGGGLAVKAMMGKSASSADQMTALPQPTIQHAIRQQAPAPQYNNPLLPPAMNPTAQAGYQQPYVAQPNMAQPQQQMSNAYPQQAAIAQAPREAAPAPAMQPLQPAMAQAAAPAIQPVIAPAVQAPEPVTAPISQVNANAVVTQAQLIALTNSVQQLSAELQRFETAQGGSAGAAAQAPKAKAKPKTEAAPAAASTTDGEKHAARHANNRHDKHETRDAQQNAQRDTSYALTGEVGNRAFITKNGSGDVNSDTSVIVGDTLDDGRKVLSIDPKTKRIWLSGGKYIGVADGSSN